MTTRAKRPQAKIAAGKGTRRSSASKPPAKKAATTKTARKPVAAAVKKTPKTMTKAANRVPAKTGKAAAPGAAKKSQKAATRATKKTPAKPAPRNLSPEAKKKLAARHLWELVEEKKRRAAQPPAWQNIGHHDHAVSPSRTVETTPQNSEPEKFHIGGHLERGGG